MSVASRAQSAWMKDLATGLPGVLREDSPAVLDRVDEPGVGLCLWRRSAPPGIIDALETLAPVDLPSGRVLAHRRDLDAAVASIVAGTLPAGSPVARFLADDVAMLATCYARIAASERVDIRLEPIGHDACWKFHRDRSRLRLVTTYRGAGTQIVPYANVDEALQAQRAYLGPIVQLPSFAVALFKGDRTEDGNSVVHRSPPIASSGVTRLVLCVDGPSPASPPAWVAGS